MRSRLLLLITITAIPVQMPNRVDVCLVKSSRCGHDRTTNVWEDQIEEYFKKYPGSYEGKCTSECSKHKDDCK